MQPRRRRAMGFIGNMYPLPQPQQPVTQPDPPMPPSAPEKNGQANR